MQLLGGGGGLEFLNRTNYSCHLLSAIFYLFRVLPEAKYDTGGGGNFFYKMFLRQLFI